MRRSDADVNALLAVSVMLSTAATRDPKTSPIDGPEEPFDMHCGGGVVPLWMSMLVGGTGWRLVPAGHWVTGVGATTTMGLVVVVPPGVPLSGGGSGPTGADPMSQLAVETTQMWPAAVQAVSQGNTQRLRVLSQRPLPFAHSMTAGDKTIPGGIGGSATGGGAGSGAVITIGGALQPPLELTPSDPHLAICGVTHPPKTKVPPLWAQAITSGERTTGGTVVFFLGACPEGVSAVPRWPVGSEYSTGLLFP
jgi:hypothetical protein